MAITRTDVLHVARLARLSLAEEEIDALIRELGRVLEYVELLREVDTTGVPATSHVTVAQAPLRDDVVSAVLDRALVLAEAPRGTDEGFAVPSFVDEG